MKNTKIKSGMRTVQADKLYTPTEYGKLKGWSPTRVRYNMLAGKIPSVEVNGLTLILLED